MLFNSHREDINSLQGIYSAAGNYFTESAADRAEFRTDKSERCNHRISAAKGLFAEVTGTLNFANIAKVLSIGIGAAIGIWLAWWGIRKLIKVITKALNGRLSLN